MNKVRECVRPGEKVFVVEKYGIHVQGSRLSAIEDYVTPYPLAVTKVREEN